MKLSIVLAKLLMNNLWYLPIVCHQFLHHCSMQSNILFLNILGPARIFSISARRSRSFDAADFGAADGHYRPEIAAEAL
jgi:hypothetical protein